MGLPLVPRSPDALMGQEKMRREAESCSQHSEGAEPLLAALPHRLAQPMPAASLHEVLRKSAPVSAVEVAPN
jgi:hypothetical protein